MERFPHEFEQLLSPSGRAVLEGRHPACGALSRQPFFSEQGLLDEACSRDAPAVLARAFTDQLLEMERMLPPANGSIAAHADMLPKTARMLTTPTDVDETSTVFARGIACGLVPMLRSASYLAFIEQLAGRKLEGPIAMQALCIRPGDYAGPHTDNHPEHENVRGGYTDVHLTFCTPGVEQQLLVYEHERHFSKVVSITGSGAVNAYRLPLWHYTTPMVGTPEARRWLVLGTFVHR